MVVAEEEEAGADESGGAEGALFKLVEPVSSHAMGVGANLGMVSARAPYVSWEGPCNRR